MFDSHRDPRLGAYSLARIALRNYLRMMRVLRGASLQTKRRATFLAAPFFGLDPWTAWRRIGSAFDDDGQRLDVDGMDLLRNLLQTIERRGLHHRGACLRRFMILTQHLQREGAKRNRRKNMRRRREDAK